jgi:phosphotransferase system enzyme I (PtsI)
LENRNNVLHEASKNIILKGIGGSPGIAIGKAYSVEKGKVDIVDKYRIRPGRVESEVKRFRNAVTESKQELARIMEGLPEEYRENTYILDAQLMLLADKKIYESTITRIEKEQINSEWALQKSVDHVREVFSKISAPYIKERINDIVHVSERILRNLTGREEDDISAINKRVILVAHDLSPADATQIQLEKVMGFITDLGGRTSHTAIIARSLEIPAVLGLEDATRRIHTGDILIIDGTKGMVIVDPDEETVTRCHSEKERFEAYEAMVARSSHLPAETLDGHQIRVMANIEMAQEVVSAIDHGGDGIGLYRTEYLYLNKKGLPTEEELFESYREVAEIMKGRPVTIRTLDIGADKIGSDLKWSREVNPALGLRAIRFCMKETGIFKTQLAAILRAAVYGDVRLMIPMISGMAEIIAARRILTDVCESLDKKGVAFKKDIKVGIMVEVPSAVVLADVLAEEVDFFSIGTNDLIQYSIAIDRGNEHVADMYQPLHPAILRMIKSVAEAARAAGIKVSICGEMACSPFHVPILLPMGIDELSMNPISIPEIKRMIRAISLEDCRSFLEEVMKKRTVRDILNIVEEEFGEKIQNMASYEPGLK